LTAGRAGTALTAGRAGTALTAGRVGSALTAGRAGTAPRWPVGDLQPLVEVAAPPRLGGSGEATGSAVDDRNAPEMSGLGAVQAMPAIGSARARVARVGQRAGDLVPAIRHNGVGPQPEPAPPVGGTARPVGGTARLRRDGLPATSAGALPGTDGRRGRPPSDRRLGTNRARVLAGMSRARTRRASARC
jgi:hypothetical protein